MPPVAATCPSGDGRPPLIWLAASKRASKTWLLLLTVLAACDTVGVKRAYMALDAAGHRKRHTFYTDSDGIYCVVEMASGVDDFSVVAKIRAQSLFDDVSGRPIDLPRNAIVGSEEQAPGRGPELNLSFVLLKPEGADFYPAGEFSCELFIDGKREESLAFEVLYPPCPFKPIEAMSSCAGLVLRGSRCPSPLGGTCECNEETALWDCE